MQKPELAKKNFFAFQCSLGENLCSYQAHYMQISDAFLDIENIETTLI